MFVDCTKAFDTVNRAGLWKILRKIGCLDKIVNLIEAFHEGMMAHVTNRTKPSSVLAKASNAFGKLTRKLRKRHDISLSTKIAVL